MSPPGYQPPVKGASRFGNERQERSGTRKVVEREEGKKPYYFHTGKANYLISPIVIVRELPTETCRRHRPECVLATTPPASFVPRLVLCRPLQRPLRDQTGLSECCLPASIFTFSTDNGCCGSCATRIRTLDSRLCSLVFAYPSNVHKSHSIVQHGLKL